MILCPDCRAEHTDIHQKCGCGWEPSFQDGISNYLSTLDRSSAETSEYIGIYDALAQRNIERPLESDRYVEHLARRFADQLGDLRGKDVCDVGAGRGYFIRHALAKEPRSVTAVDIASPSLSLVAKTYGIPSFLANAENLPFRNRFDVIAATDILEHVLNMPNFLITANLALRDGGMLAVRVPYRENMMQYSNFLGLPMHYTHLRTFDRTTLVDLIESAGFSVQRVFYDGFQPQYLRAIWNPIAGPIRSYLSARFASFDEVTAIDPRLGRILMRPIEIGVLAKQIQRPELSNLYEDLARYYQPRKAAPNR